MLLSQTIEAEILVIDSGSTDATPIIAARYAPRVRLLEIPRERFDHGGTRDYALRQSTGDFVCFFTQDALPEDERCLERLLSAFSAPDVAAVYGRQIAYPDAPEYERLTRAFNYPVEPRTWREADIPYYGVKSYFFSNVCSAYRREAYLAVGGFDTPIISNEDMMMAAKLLHAGYALAYTPDAAVYHSHRYTLAEELRRNIRIGKAMDQYRIRCTSPGPALYRQQRLGRNGKPFMMLKFRSMLTGSESLSAWTVRNDPRRTELGIWLRRFSLDELPQPINVFRGDMSLVGPRPEQPMYRRRISGMYSGLCKKISGAPRYYWLGPGKWVSRRYQH